MKPSLLSSIIPYHHFTAEGEIRLRGGGTLIGEHIRGPSLEASSSEDIAAACARFAASLGHFTTGDFIHLIFHRVPAVEYPVRTFESRAAQMIDDERRAQFHSQKYLRTLTGCYIANEDESAISNRLKAMFFASTAHRAIENRELQVRRFYHRVHGWEDAIASTFKPRRMSTAEMYRDLVLGINGIDYPATPPPAGVPLHHVLAQQDFIGGSEPRIGQLHLRPVSVISPWPSETTPQTLAALLTNPGEMTLSVRFICLDPVDAARQLALERKHYVRAAIGSPKDWLLNDFNVPRRECINQDNEQRIAEVDEARAKLAGGTAYGWCTITAIVRGPDKDEVNSRARQVAKDLATAGYASRIEDANAVEAVKGSWAGQGSSNVRRPLISGDNFAELTMPVEHWEGTPHIDSTFYPKRTPVPLICTGTAKEPFFAPSHIRSVGCQLLIGPTTGGKSTLLGAMVAATTVLPNVRILWLDRDFSSFVLTHALGGRYLELAADGASPLCPFQWLDGEYGTTWLYDWCSRLFLRWEIALDERQSADLSIALELAKQNGMRTMSEFTLLIQDPRMRGVLQHYCARGQWSHVFDGEPVDDRAATLTTIEMRELDTLGPRAAAPATELIIHGVEVGLGDTPTVVFADESWRLLSDDISRRWLNQALRTFRKFNASLIMATQSLTEIAHSEVRSLILESCPVKIFLPNSAARGEHVAALYRALGLSERSIEVISDATPQRDYFYSTPLGERLARLDLGGVARALVASTGANEVKQARDILAEAGPEQFLDAWLHAHHLGPAPKALVPPALTGEWLRQGLSPNGAIANGGIH